MFNSLRHWYKQYHKFSKKDRNGIMVLSVLVVLVIIINILLNFIKTKTAYDYSEFERAINESELSQTTSNRNNNNQNNNKLFPFNPNTITSEELDSLALPSYIKRNLLSYREAGGRIRSANDFRRIYGMNDSIFDAVKDFLLFELLREISEPPRSTIPENNRSEPQRTPNNRTANTAMLKIELNSADSTELTKLYGIGPVFASRIVRYRDLLGGFYKNEQLLEVYNFPEETFKSLGDNIETDPDKIKKIQLNLAEFAELLRHPYLSREQVQAIINYRNKHGAYQSVSDLIQNNILDSLTFSRIEPYLETR